MATPLRGHGTPLRFSSSGATHRHDNSVVSFLTLPRCSGTGLAGVRSLTVAAPISAAVRLPISYLLSPTPPIPPRTHR